MKIVVQFINRVQIFENNFFNNSFHDFNFFIFFVFKHIRKCFLNNIIIDAINKSTKTFKTTKKKSLNKKNKFYISKESCVNRYVIFYFFTFLLFFILLFTNQKIDTQFLFYLFSHFFYFFFNYNLFRFFCSTFFVFDSKKNEKKKKQKQKKSKNKNEILN